MIRIRAWWIFYRKIFLYSVLLTGLLAVAVGSPDPGFIGITYAILTPCVQLFFYELSSPQEYYFYANLGLIRLQLWIITGGITLAVITLISLLL